ncbi:LPXTG cell wall anchor domain-containing protein [Mediterraneibacter gnavus]|uniref:LPXTG cell wall anchor domain-containing protein n=1 Tax=Mediterraneibacter gnavus TaxID=33038 RepID=A0A9X3KAH4_MEDGN|nr:LPXTG cell wall anchor domain-containing protein [Mediterraneibacter gnavus]MCZ7693100.1 LPXTG cell wall anchor domain-containing protein [Mediterraneibacter gnavus]MCZ7734742.1 LPXTG cell wall anchor domain-containing protein [Mediterraneibacter gnavus]MDC6146315.1 LPXTG cell wall anchor domain-containing protein [Mediterraneibacter gnavus]MDE1199732.1 LPXTG cell wall anchor domain-containing protein [Mediterraneibacter gnavus]
MKKKFVVALVAAMSLTVVGTGTVFAMDKVSTIASEKEHVHGDNCEWVVDKEAWDEEVVVVDKPAWDEEVEVPEQGHYETVVVKPAWDEEVHRIGTFCHNCGFEIHSIDEWIAHSEASNGQCMSYGNKEVTEIIHHEAVTEQKWVVDVPAHTEIVHHDAITHIEIVHHPEEGHWVCNGEPQEPEQKPENPDQKPEQPENPEQKPEQPENPDQKPEQPENPDQKPEQPENPDVETPETPDAENPETPEQKPEANKENIQTQETETKKEGTSPKTGDTTSALPVAGAGLASLGVALATILKKRK